MNEARYPSKERIEREGVLIYAEGDDLVDDPDEAKRQGYKVVDVEERIAKKRIERDGVLIAAEGDVLPDDEKADDAGADKAERPAEDKSRQPAKKK